MNKTYVKIFFLYLFIALIFIQCNKSFITERPESLTVAAYEDFRSKLMLAYEADNYYSIAFQLANLKAPNHLIYKHLKKAVKENTGLCESIFEMNRLAVHYGFYKNLYKADTAQFYEVFDLCLQKLGENAYQEYDERQLREEDAYINSRPSLDSARMKPALISLLQEMQENDQKYRKKLADDRIQIPEAEKSALWKLQKELDSLNLIKADSILTHYGYPGVQEVGYDLSNTIWFVLQHQ
ncbi:MAG: hypothetical protein ACK4TA_00190 [Saprospiraceae bacterium]